MLNINQNFDLKAPVFNFDRDYFNSVEELKAYDTSNVPDHFVTNVAGTLYQFTDGKWLPMIGTIVAPGSQKSYSVNLSNNNCYIFNDPENNKSIFTIGDISYAQIDTNGCIQLTDERDGEFPYIDITKTPIDVYKNIRIGQNTEEFGLTITDDTTGDIQILTNKELTEEEQDNGYSPVNMSLTDGGYEATINAEHGFTHKTDEGFVSTLDGYGLNIKDANCSTYITSSTISCGDDFGRIYVYGDEGRVEASSASGECTNYGALGLAGHSGDNSKQFSLSIPNDADENGEVSLSLKNADSSAKFNTNGFRISSGSVSDSKEISLSINDTAANGDYGSPVHMCLADPGNDGTININACDGFTHTDSDGRSINIYSSGISIDDKNNGTYIYTGKMRMCSNIIDGSIEINTNKELTEDEQDNGYSQVDMSLTDGDYNATINAKNGFTHTKDDGFVAHMDGYGIEVQDPVGWKNYISESRMSITNNGKSMIYVGIDTKDSCIHIGDDKKFKISRPADNTEGATITGVKSITAFSDPSNTKVFATDGSIVDLSTKANTSDVLLKKSASGGYYIEENSNELGQKAFAANSSCTASGNYSHAEGNSKATSEYSHAEGQWTKASASSAHSEGYNTSANGRCSHAEGVTTLTKGKGSHSEGVLTISSGIGSHAQGMYNVDNINAIHSVGIGYYDSNSGNDIRRNAEYIYVKYNEAGLDIVDDPKNGYKYLIGVGGYDGISKDNTTYKSVQEVIADLTARIEQLEKLTANRVPVSNADEQTNQ